MSTKLLIIGGTGNISRWITSSLLEKGYDITVYNRQKMDSGKQPGNLHLIRGDRQDRPRFEQQISGAGFFDIVIDMAAYEPEDATSAIRCFSGKTAQYIFCSTVDIYSKKRDQSRVADTEPACASPSFPYAYKKMQMERALQKEAEQSLFPVTILRPGFTYSQGWSPLLTCFGGQTYYLDRMQKRKPMILQDGGSIQWNVSHSKDVAEAFVGAAGNSSAIGRCYNVTGDEKLSWRMMHSIVAKILNVPVPLFVTIPTTVLANLSPEHTHWCVENFQYPSLFDNTAAKQDLGYKYTVTFDSGARSCIEYLQSRNLIEDETPHIFYDDVLKEWSKSKEQTFQPLNAGL